MFNINNACGAIENQCPDITVVLPVYRNKDTLRDLHRRLRIVFKSEGIGYEIIFVDDACPGGSLAVLKELAGLDPRVAVLALGANSGQHQAVMTGLRFSRGRRVILLDADLQDPPEAIPALLSRMNDGFDAVFAGRRGQYESSGRLFTSRIFKGLLHRLSGVPIDAGMFVALSRGMVERLLAMNVSRPFIVAMIGCAGLPLASIPVERSCRPSGHSAYSSWKRLKTGCLAIIQVLKLKSGRDLFFEGSSGQAEVKAFIGSRFDTAL